MGLGYSLSELLKKVSRWAAQVMWEFVNLATKSQMPGCAAGVLDWPYTEGCGWMKHAPADAAAFGMYGEVLPARMVRRCVCSSPWKVRLLKATSRWWDSPDRTEPSTPENKGGA